MDHRSRKALATACALLLVCIAASAAAVEVYLNGVKITGLADQTIEGAKVVLDKGGNVYITAPEYKVRELGAGGTNTAPTPAPTPSPPPPRKSNLINQYFVITEVARAGVTGYSLQLIVNNQYIKDLPDSIPQQVVELNDYLQKGSNTVSFRALRPAGRSAQSTNASDTFSALVGVGKVSPGGQLTIDEVLAEFKVSAVDRGEKSQSFTVKAK
ncbi:MAG: hypothetical protein JXR96_24695 [Deltaproteobacteria bacterium]|nr:hypothetical protein [Deltaproteobacteria bacterium]